jgi:dihydroxyacetone kinase-like predicted kinase
MNYFQVGTSENMKRQVARVLHRQSILYEAEGNHMMHSIMAVAAREALAQVLMAGNDANVAVTSPQTLLPLSQEVFDELVEPWFR